MTPTQAATEIWGADNPFPEAISAAAYIRSHTAPDTLIAVLGSEPEIYFYAHRRSATPYIYMYGLMEPQPYALKMQNDVVRDLRTTARSISSTSIRHSPGWSAKIPRRAFSTGGTITGPGATNYPDLSMTSPFTGANRSAMP